MGLSAQHILLLMIVALLLFGRGKISELMGDVAKGIKSFKKGMAEDDEVAKPVSPRTIENEASRRRKTAPNRAYEAASLTVNFLATWRVSMSPSKAWSSL